MTALNEMPILYKQFSNISLLPLRKLESIASTKSSDIHGERIDGRESPPGSDFCFLLERILKPFNKSVRQPGGSYGSKVIAKSLLAIKDDVFGAFLSL